MPLLVSNYVIVNNNTNPNCLFYFDDSSEAKKLVKKSGSYFSSYTQVTDRNIVTGTTAGNINFVEGYGAYVPYSFRANNVTYTRKVLMSRRYKRNSLGTERAAFITWSWTSAACQAALSKQ